MTLTVEPNTLSLNDAHRLLKLQKQPNGLFTDYLTLEPLTEFEQEDLSRIRNDFEGYLAAGKISEGMVKFFTIAPLMRLAGFYDIPIRLTMEDVEITSQDIEGWLVANANGITVALDIVVTPDLRKEGIARELVNRIQNIRKESGFEVTDKIKVVLQNNAVLEEAVASNIDYIKSETLTEELVFEDNVEDGTEIEFDDIKTKITITNK